jgi:hypothetical protein
MLTFALKYWKYLLIGLVLLTLAGSILYAKSLKTENARLTVEVTRSQAVINRLNQDIKANQLALKQRAAESEALAKERQEAFQSLEKIYETDKEACDWSSGLIPDGVYDQLCQ